MTYEVNALRPPHMPISTRLTIWYGLTLLVLLSLYALFSYSSFRRSLESDFDLHLRQEIEDLLPYVDLDAELPVFLELDNLRSVAYRTDGYYGAFVRLFSSAGEELYRSPNYAGHVPLQADLSEELSIHFVSREWENKPTRTGYVSLKSADGGFKGWIEVTAVEWTMYRDLGRFGLELVLGLLTITGLALGGGYWMARRALHPVTIITNAANRIRSTDLSVRLPTRFASRDELSALAETLNSLIARLETSVHAERRFTANAAHELLTPLTTMRGELDLALRRPREADSYRSTLNIMLRDTDNLIQIVHHLIQLSQTEALADLPGVEINLSRLVTDRVARFTSRTVDELITLEQDITENIWVVANESRLTEMLNNLLDNALKYTPKRGQISVRLTGTPTLATLTISDTGIGFTDEDKSHLFERFYRADDPYVQNEFGSGLGLSIVQTIVKSFDGTVAAESGGKNKGSTFTVSLPCT